MGTIELMRKINHYKRYLTIGDIVIYDGMLPIWRISDAMQSREQIAIMAYAIGKGYRFNLISKKEGMELAKEVYEAQYGKEVNNGKI